MHTYTTSDIADLIRMKMDDTTKPYMIDDDLLASEIDTAQREFVVATRCLFDNVTQTVAVTAGEPLYDVDDNILHIRNGELSSDNRTIEPVTAVEISSRYTGTDYGMITNNWKTATGTPWYMVTDLDPSTIRLVPIPVADDTLTLSAHMYPDVVNTLDDALQIPNKWRKDLMYGVMAALYNVQDAELYDPRAADKYARIWQIKLLQREGEIEKHKRGPGIVQHSKNGVW